MGGRTTLAIAWTRRGIGILGGGSAPAELTVASCSTSLVPWGRTSVSSPSSSSPELRKLHHHSINGGDATDSPQQDGSLHILQEEEQFGGTWSGVEQPWKRTRPRGAARYLGGVREVPNRRERVIEGLKRALEVLNSSPRMPPIRDQACKAVEQHYALLCEAAVSGTANDFLRAARQRPEDIAPGALGGAFSRALRRIPSASVAEEALVAAARDGTLDSRSAARSLAVVLDKCSRSGGPLQVIGMASRLMGRTESCLKAGRPQPCNQAVQVVMRACGALADRGLAVALWEDLSTTMVRGQPPSRASAISYLAAAVECDIAVAIRRGRSTVRSVLDAGSFTLEALARLKTDQGMRVAALPEHLTVRLLESCQSAAEVDELLFSVLVERRGEGQGQEHETLEENGAGYNYAGWMPEGFGADDGTSHGVVSGALGWVPPVLSPPLARASVTALMRLGHPSAAWHIIWQADGLGMTNMQPLWEAAANSCAESGDIVGASRAIVAARQRGAFASQVLLLKLLRATVRREVPGPLRVSSLKEAAKLWDSGMVKHTAQAHRIWLGCIAASGEDRGPLMFSALQQAIDSLKPGPGALPFNRKELSRLSCAAAMSSVRLAGQPWSVRLGCLRNCLAALTAVPQVTGRNFPSPVDDVTMAMTLQAALSDAPCLGVVRREGVLADIVGCFLEVGVSPGQRTLGVLAQHTHRSSSTQLNDAGAALEEALGGGGFPDTSRSLQEALDEIMAAIEADDITRLSALPEK